MTRHLAFILSLGLAPAALPAQAPDPAPAVTPPQPVGPARIASGVMAGQILTKAPLRYPDDAKAAGIRGTVVLNAIIGKDGHITHLDAIAGPNALRDPAMDAVRLWIYKPYLLNGEPTEVNTTIVVHYNLDDNQPAPVYNPVRITAAISGGDLLKSPPPVYPFAAREANAQGKVSLAVIVDKQGVPAQIFVISGSSVFTAAAMEAARQQRYTPALRHNEPVEFLTKVTFAFAQPQ